MRIVPWDHRPQTRKPGCASSPRSPGNLDRTPTIRHNGRITNTGTQRNMTKRSKAPPRRPSMPATPWDQGADGPANREGLVDQERGETDLATGEIINPNKVFGKVRMPLFRRYAKQGRITADHAETAHRIYAAYAGHPNRDPLAAITDRVDGGGTEDPNVTMMDARRAFYAMWDRIPPRYRPVVEHVVLNDLPIGAMSGGTKPEVAAHLFGQLTAGLEAAA